MKHYCQDILLMIGKKKINEIKALAQKKFRHTNGLFLIEGDKTILEVLASRFQIKELFATETFIRQHNKKLKKVENIIETSYNEIKRASLLKNPQQSLAICYMPIEEQLPSGISGISFYLDGIQDPGNLGTILRTADWFGMEYLFCSPDTADLYNPKVIQSSMGSFCRVKTIYMPFDKIATLSARQNIQLFGTFMNGMNIYSAKLPRHGIIVLGNEGNGIRREVEEKIEIKLNIPSFKSGTDQPESLNVAVAAAVIASEFMRRVSQQHAIQNES